MLCILNYFKNMADLHDFQVDIVPDQESVTTNKKDGSYYVEMPKNNVQYRIRLKNNGLVRCDAVVTIDGKNMGTFRINAHSQMLLERPPDVERRFTFFIGGSEGSKQGGHKPKDKNNGLVEVLFKPEKKPEFTPNFFESRNIYRHCEDFDAGSEMMWCDSEPARTANSFGAVPQPNTKRMTNPPTHGYEEGMTALTGDSSQKFTIAAFIDYDCKNEVTVYLRLVYRDVRPKVEPLRSVGSKKSTRYPNSV